LIHGYCLEGKLNDALSLFHEMKMNGRKPDVVTYNVLVGGFSRNGVV
jgi:pentatricopeptide repeat protein